MSDYLERRELTLGQRLEALRKADKRGQDIRKVPHLRADVYRLLMDGTPAQKSAVDGLIARADRRFGVKQSAGAGSPLSTMIDRSGKRGTTK